MPDRSADIERMAELYVGFGANLQPGQLLGVTAYLGMEEIARAITRAAYKRGAKYVDVFWWDPWIKRARLEYADEATLEYVPPWLGERLFWLGDERAARISLVGADPSAFDGLDPARAGRDVMPYIKEAPIVVNAQTTSWTIAPFPTLGWAQQVFPELPPDKALDRLWEEVLHTLRLDEPDPIAAWHERMDTLISASSRLTEHRFDAIHLKGPGTDVTVGLLPSSKWQAADFVTIDGQKHYPNLPTEEVFTTPDPERVDGFVTATKPLDFYGAQIDGIRIRFAGGRAVEIDADKGADALRGIAAKDDGASRLGELALVDGQGRIGPLGTIFHETLFDENAASHVALGNAYTFPVEDEADRARINTSAIHCDFMIGSPELDVDGLARDGRRVPILRGGDWQI